MQTLNGKVAIVTGGGTGIGRAIAFALASEGVKVAICGRRHEPLAQTAAQIEAQAGTALFVPTDVSQAEEVEQLVKITSDSLGPVDILINNAAIGGGKAIHEVTVDEWDKMMAINVRGPFLMARAVLPLMRQRQQGHIINISSEVAVGHYAGTGVYAVSKHALNALAEIMQRENQKFGIQVNTICPGLVATETMANNPRLNKEKCLQPADIANTVLWLFRNGDRARIGQPILLQTVANPWL
jgi:3-oxoacyl-[acyl-carrier protein] reductase